LFYFVTVIRALLIDDEESTVTVLQLLLKQYVPEVNEVYTAVGAQQGLQMINEVDPHLLFLDIEMPYMSGFELLEQFPDHGFEVIFVTAYDHYAIKAIKYSALDYLLKPIDTEELKQSVQRFISSRNMAGNTRPLYENLLYNLNQPKTSDYRLAISTTEGTSFYEAQEIIRCEAVGNYTRFHIKEKKPVITSRTLKEYEDLLADHQFLRVHRTHLVNPRYIQAYTRDHELKMQDGSVVQVSRRKWEGIKEKVSLSK
jgi:two-component system LytT family response regulator